MNNKTNLPHVSGKFLHGCVQRMNSLRLCPPPHVTDRVRVLGGFTLAEVLITLSIIGIVAALTMPSLIAKYQKQQTITQFRKAYAEINQAFKLAEVDNGEIGTWDITNLTFGKERSTYFADTYIFKYLKPVKTCYSDFTPCWTFAKTISGNDSFLDTYMEAISVSAVFKSGYSIFTWADLSGKTPQMYIDVNGPKKGPNVFGKDIFNVRIPLQSNSSILLATDKSDRNILINDPEYGCSKDINTNTAGLYCSRLIEVDGWEIKDDYPW